jgi:hypothetical protein
VLQQRCCLADSTVQKRPTGRTWTIAAAAVLALPAGGSSSSDVTGSCYCAHKGCASLAASSQLPASMVCQALPTAAAHHEPTGVPLQLVVTLQQMLQIQQQVLYAYCQLPAAAVLCCAVLCCAVLHCRESHPATLKTGVESVTKAAPRLPSDKDPAFTYGKPGAYR